MDQDDGSVMEDFWPGFCCVLLYLSLSFKFSLYLKGLLASLRCTAALWGLSHVWEGAKTRRSQRAEPHLAGGVVTNLAKVS